MVEAKARLFIIPLQGSHPLGHIQMFPAVKLWLEDSIFHSLFPHFNYSVPLPVIAVQRPGKGLIIIVLEITFLYTFKIRISSNSNGSNNCRISIFIFIPAKYLKQI